MSRRVEAGLPVLSGMFARARLEGQRATAFDSERPK